LFGKFCFSYWTSNHPKKITKKGIPSMVHAQLEVDRSAKNLAKKTNFSSVIGLWKCEDDENWRFEFLNNGSCIEAYVGSSSDTSNYSISNTTPQCGVTVAVDQYTEYIKLIFPNDSTQNSCYLLNGTTDSTLSLGAKIVEDFDMSRQAIAKHIKILNECGIISMSQKGRNQVCEAQLGHLDEVTDWVTESRKLWNQRFAKLDTFLATMKK
jgi:biotin operon repressor